jgi:hypothetical protein
MRLERPLDVFGIREEGGLRWIGTAETLEAAKALIKKRSLKNNLEIFW